MGTETATPSPIGLNIKEARERKDLTQLELAHKIGYQGDDAGAYISRLESGHQEPRLKTLQKIADALGMGVEKLLKARK
jgi:transcriptional regulator with XRE-family HTH domain